MKRYTQKELLNEVLWRGIKGLAGAAVRGGAETLRRTLPELTDPIDKLEKGMREIGDEFRAGWHRGWGKREGLVNDNLNDEGYMLVNEPNPIIKSGRYYLARANKLADRDKKGNPVPGAYEYRFLIDREGRIIRNIDRNRIDTTRSAKAQQTRRDKAKKGRF